MDTRDYIKAIYADYMWLHKQSADGKDIVQAMRELGDSIARAMDHVSKTGATGPFRSVDYK